MQYFVDSVEQYLASIPDDRRDAISRLRQEILDNLPDGFDEFVSGGMLSYSVPKSIYPKGYHVTPEEPLPFIGLASQKNYISFYHMGMMVFPDVLNWFKEEYQKLVPTKLDMGKSCIRLKNMNDIPYELMGELCTKITVEEYIDGYENAVSNKGFC